MKKIRLRGHFYFILIIIFLVCGAIYLNMAYAHIYKKIQSVRLKAVNELVVYNFNDKNNYNGNVATSYMKYVALGDSLTFGVGTDNYQESYPYLISEKLAAKDSNKPLSFYNYSWPGDKSSDLIAKFLNYAIEEKPNIVTVLIGVNDIHNQVSAADFKINYDKILSSLTKETKADIYAVSIPYIGSNKTIFFPYNYYFDYKTKQFNKIIKDLADKYKVDYIDLYSPTVNLFKKSGEHYSLDFFHPSASGYALWGQIIYDNINK